jgi:hypothetical protein
VIRLYLLEGYDFASRDIGSFSDPYMVLTCGKKVYNERDNYTTDEPNPKFFKHYDFNTSFPGAQPLVIEAYDYDLLFGDDLIGTTVVDLDDRFFSRDWQAIESKPIEYRTLKHESSSVGQGVVKMFLEINPTDKTPENIKVWDITPQPIKEYEVRLIVWDTKEIVNMDYEGTSDIYIRAFFDTSDSKETDCHYRCQNGCGSFNYRVLFDVKGPNDYYDLTI